MTWPSFKWAHPVGNTVCFSFREPFTVTVSGHLCCYINGHFSLAHADTMDRAFVSDHWAAGSRRIGLLCLQHWQEVKRLFHCGAYWHYWTKMDGLQIMNLSLTNLSPSIVCSNRRDHAGQGECNYMPSFCMTKQFWVNSLTFSLPMAKSKHIT